MRSDHWGDAASTEVGTPVSTAAGGVSDFDGPQNRNYLVKGPDFFGSLVIAASYRSAAF